MSRTDFVFLFLIFFLSYLEAAKILCVFQVPILSHKFALRCLTDKLLKHKHEIDVVTVYPWFTKDQAPQNMTEIDIQKATYAHKIWRKEITEDKSDKKDSVYSQTIKALDLLVNICRNQYASNEFQELIKSEKSYDLIIADGTSTSTVFLSHILNAPLIGISTCCNFPIVHKYMGIPRHVFYYPEITHERCYNLTIFDLYKAIYTEMKLLSFFDTLEKNIYSILNEDFILKLPIDKRQNNHVHMLCVNNNPIWEGIRPLPINYVLFKFDAQRSNLTEDIQSYLDVSKDGVVYASFGTSVVFSLLPKHAISVIFRVFSQLPYQVLLKCDKEELAGRPKNVKLFKWLPQADVLKHPKIKLFITQGGQHSIDEAIEAGVPMIVVPNVFDQFANSERCVHHGIGTKIDMKTISEENLMDAIKNIVEDKRYRENIVKLRTILQDTPMKSMDRLMWAIDYIIRHGGAKHMRSPSAGLSWAEYFELELVCILLSIIVVILVLIVSLLLSVKGYVVRVIRGRYKFNQKNIETVTAF